MRLVSWTDCEAQQRARAGGTTRAPSCSSGGLKNNICDSMMVNGISTRQQATPSFVQLIRGADWTILSAKWREPAVRWMNMEVCVAAHG